MIEPKVKDIFLDATGKDEQEIVAMLRDAGISEHDIQIILQRLRELR